MSININETKIQTWDSYYTYLNLKRQAEAILGSKIMEQLNNWPGEVFYITKEKKDALDILGGIYNPDKVWHYINGLGIRIKLESLMGDVRDNDYSHKITEEEIKQKPSNNYVKKVLELLDIMEYARSYNINWADLVEDAYRLEDYINKK